MNITAKIPTKIAILPSKQDILSGLLLIALSRAGFYEMYPLGFAYAAVFAEKNAYISLLSLCLGMFSYGFSSIKYIFAFFLYYILIYIKKTKDVEVKAVAAGFSVLISGFLFSVLNGFKISSLLLFSAEAAAVGTAFYIFSFSGQKSEKARLAELILLGGALSGISSITATFSDTDISAFFALFICMSLCYALEMSEAVLSCAVLGFITNISNPDAVMLCGAFALSALLSSALSYLGKFGTAVGFLCGITVSLLYRGTLFGIHPADLLIPAVVFVLIPETLHFKISAFINSRLEAEYEEDSSNTRVAAQLRTVAKAVCDLADGVTLLSAKNRRDSELYEMFDTVSSRVCRGCPLEANCLKKDSKKTYSNMYELWKTIEEDGYCDSANMPLSFRQICMRSERFLTEFRHAYELYKQNTLHYGEALSGRDIMAKQYSELSNVITRLSDEVETGACIRDESEPSRCAFVTVVQEAKRGQEVCGDTVIHFQKDEKYFVILCDGMGSGDSAMSESRLTAKLFAEFLKAGFEKETALSMINSALALKVDQESFSTADLLEINLETGVAEFLKIGSAQSFLKTKDNIEIISSKSLPVGILENVDALPQLRQLKAGDVILMISDGISEAGSGVLKNDWIKKLLSEDKYDDEELARLILSGAKSRTKFSDDMTCAVIRIKKNRRTYNE